MWFPRSGVMALLTLPRAIVRAAERRRFVPLGASWDQAETVFHWTWGEGGKIPLHDVSMLVRKLRCVKITEFFFPVFALQP